jgi:hypothetical protein
VVLFGCHDLIVVVCNSVLLSSGKRYKHGASIAESLRSVKIDGEMLSHMTNTIRVQYGKVIVY